MVSSFIGMDRSLTLELFRNSGLTPFRSVLRPDFFVAATERTLRAGTVLVPEVVFWLMALAALTEGTLAAAMVGFWAPLRSLQPDMPLLPVTEEAFATARKKLSLTFFQTLFHSVVRDFNSRFAERYLWHGFKLWGVDGSTLNLPSSKRLREAFPPAGNQHGANNRPQALLVGLVGLRTGVCLDYSLSATSDGEQPCARRVIKSLGPLDLLLGDRNFPDTESMALLLSQRSNFLFRLASGRFQTRARDWISRITGKEEWYVIVKVPAKLREANPDFPLEMKLRVLEYQLPGFRPSWLITSLVDASTFAHSDLVTLYHERWQQETQHREWKHTLNLSNLRSETAEGIRKELAVQLTLNNAVRWIMAEAGTLETRPVGLKFRETKRIVLAFVHTMALASAKVLPVLYEAMLDAVRKQTIMVRPGRSYPRRKKAGPRNKGNGKFAAEARIAPQVKP